MSIKYVLDFCVQDQKILKKKRNAAKIDGRMARSISSKLFYF